MRKKQEGTYSFADNVFRSKMHDLGDALRREKVKSVKGLKRNTQ